LFGKHIVCNSFDNTQVVDDIRTKPHGNQLARPAKGHKACEELLATFNFCQLISSPRPFIDDAQSYGPRNCQQQVSTQVVIKMSEICILCISFGQKVWPSLAIKIWDTVGHSLRLWPAGSAARPALYFMHKCSKRIFAILIC